MALKSGRRAVLCDLRGDQVELTLRRITEALAGMESEEKTSGGQSLEG